MKQKTSKKWGICILRIILMVVSIRCEASAVTFDDINSDSMFF